MASSNAFIADATLKAAKGVAVGLGKGHVVEKRELAPRPASRKGKLGKRVKMIRELVREVAGFAPYEKRVMELLKVGKDKRALKVAKRKVRSQHLRRPQPYCGNHCGCATRADALSTGQLGTHLRAKNKREEMTGALRKMRAAGQEARSPAAAADSSVCSSSFAGKEGEEGKVNFKLLFGDFLPRPLYRVTSHTLSTRFFVSCDSAAWRVSYTELHYNKV